MKNIPEKIYLQIGDDADIDTDDFNDLYEGAITWSVEQINSNDIEYVRKQELSFDEIEKELLIRISGNGLPINRFMKWLKAKYS